MTRPGGQAPRRGPLRWLAARRGQWRDRVSERVRHPQPC